MLLAITNLSGWYNEFFIMQKPSNRLQKYQYRFWLCSVNITMSYFVNGFSISCLPRSLIDQRNNNNNKTSFRKRKSLIWLSHYNLERYCYVARVLNKLCTSEWQAFEQWALKLLAITVYFAWPSTAGLKGPVHVSWSSLWAHGFQN